MCTHARVHARVCGRAARAHVRAQCHRRWHARGSRSSAAPWPSEEAEQPMNHVRPHRAQIRTRENNTRAGKQTK
eukprot:3800075-Alexandrium_andersonii.AAC.1